MKVAGSRLPQLALLLAAMVLGPDVALAAEFRADASFAVNDGCISTRAFLFVKNAKAYVTVDKFNYCQHKQVLQVVARNVNLNNGGLVVDKTLGSASLDATVQFVDQLRQNKKNATLHVSWLAIGDPVSVEGVDDVDEPGKKNSRVLRKTTRLAQAYGAIVLDNQTINLGRAEDAVIVMAQK